MARRRAFPLNPTNKTLLFHGASKMIEDPKKSSQAQTEVDLHRIGRLTIVTPDGKKIEYSGEGNMATWLKNELYKHLPCNKETATKLVDYIATNLNQNGFAHAGQTAVTNHLYPLRGILGKGEKATADPATSREPTLSIGPSGTVSYIEKWIFPRSLMVGTASGVEEIDFEKPPGTLITTSEISVENNKINHEIKSIDINITDKRFLSLINNNGTPTQQPSPHAEEHASRHAENIVSAIDQRDLVQRIKDAVSEMLRSLCDTFNSLKKSTGMRP